MTQLTRKHVAIAALVALMGGCEEAEDDFHRKNVGPGAADDPSVPKCTDVGKAYVGFSGTKLEDKRVNAKIGADRARIKPYSALKGEYERLIGVAPGSLGQAAPAFGNPPERFASEPRANAIQVYSAFRVAFDGCLAFSETKPEYATAPTPGTASAQCTALARRFWSRAPTPDEVKACVDVATVDSASETAPRRRWAYTCATLLSTAGFLTY
jgi:hypothetical protein